LFEGIDCGGKSIISKSNAAEVKAVDCLSVMGKSNLMNCFLEAGCSNWLSLRESFTKLLSEGRKGRERICYCTEPEEKCIPGIGKVFGSYRALA